MCHALVIYSPILPDLILGLEEHSGSVVECLTRDRGVAGLSLTGGTGIVSLSKTHSPLITIVLVQPRKNRPDLTEKLLTVA